jgi:hypothetical protein
MAEERAGIYFPRKMRKAFCALPEASQERLRVFLVGQREQLETFGGGRKEGCAGEWEPGFVVYWDVNLKPQYRTARRKAVGASGLKTLGSLYRIEILEIRRLS